MNQIWQLETAIVHLKDIIKNAIDHKLQIIELNNQKVVIISIEDYEKSIDRKSVV